MKATPIRFKLTAACWLLTCSAWLAHPAASCAQVVLASWQNDTGDGCIDWSAFSGNGYNSSVASITSTVTTNAYSGNLPIYTNVYSFAQDVVPGYAQSLAIKECGYTANLTLNLTAAQFQAFATNNLLSFTFSVPGGTYTGGYSQIPQIVINCNGSWGYATVPYSNTKLWSATGATGADGTGSSFQPNFYFNDGANSLQSQTVTLNYASIASQITNNGYGYLQIIFSANNGGGAPCDWYMNNITLSQSPSQIVYTVDDFSTNGVGPENPTNNDYFATAESYFAGNISDVWSTWFGNAVTVSFDPNVNVSGDTNANGAMALGLSWASASGNYQQFLVWQGNSATYVPAPGGATGIGYPQYTNLECDVMFDPSSAGVTNTNGVLGVIRLGVRGDGSYGQDWLSTSYTTISDTNWHHINAALTSSDATLASIGGVIIGEDVNGYVGGGGLNGDQILYVDNIRFTGPLVTPLTPPPSLEISKATPGTARFWTTSPQYTRTELATQDPNQSWIGGPGDSGDISSPYSKPVSYSFTLSSLTEDTSAQTTLWLVDDLTGTYNGSDYTLGTELWLNIVANPPHGWTAAVAWKANDTGANPTNTALFVTNTLGVGTWTLAFTGETNGTLMAPGWQVASNFTIADPNVATDFANPLSAILGIQGNGSGFGSYDDFTQISITNVAGANELDVFANDTAIETNTLWMETLDSGAASGYYQITNAADNFASAYPATVQAIFLVTTNDPFWVTWNVTTNGYGLAESSSLNLRATPPVSPASFSGYSDMPVQVVAGATNWALIPADCLAPGKEGFFEVVNPPPLQ